MGSQTKYNTKFLVWVSAKIGDDGDGGSTDLVKYGFPTNVPSTYGNILGHTVIPESQYGDPPTGLVLGASSPKPRRASKRETNRFVSSFVSQGKLLDARKQGYRIAKSKARSQLILASNTNALVKTVYVPVRGIKRAWNIPKVTETNAGSLSVLGIEDANASDKDEICFGADFPVPPRATKLVVSGDDVKEIETFYDPTKTSATGWILGGGGRLSLI